MQVDEEPIRSINHIIFKLNLSDLIMLGMPWVVKFVAKPMVVVFKQIEIHVRCWNVCLFSYVRNYSWESWGTLVDDYIDVHPPFKIWAKWRSEVRVWIPFARGIKTQEQSQSEDLICWICLTCWLFVCLKESKCYKFHVQYLFLGVSPWDSA